VSGLQSLRLALRGELAPLPDDGMFVDDVEGPGDEDDGFSMKKALEYGEAHVRDKGRGNTFLHNFLIFGFRRPGIPVDAGISAQVETRP
jgi:hypothetical protein